MNNDWRITSQKEYLYNKTIKKVFLLQEKIGIMNIVHFVGKKFFQICKHTVQRIKCTGFVRLASMISKIFLIGN